MSNSSPRRFYTRHWSGPRAGPEMAEHALRSYPAWEEEIEAWQAKYSEIFSIFF